MGTDFTAYAQSFVSDDYIEVQVRGRNSQAAARWLKENGQRLIDEMMEKIKEEPKIVSAECLRSLLAEGSAIVNQRVILMLSKRDYKLGGDFTFVALMDNRSIAFSFDPKGRTEVKVVFNTKQRWRRYSYYLQTTGINTDKERAEVMYQALAEGLSRYGLRGTRGQSLVEALQTMKMDWFGKRVEYLDLCTVVIEPGRRVRGDVKEFERMLSEWEESAVDGQFDLAFKYKMSTADSFDVGFLEERDSSRQTEGRCFL